ncbi:MAG: NACHT domain-containing protein, partial [Cyanobacteria bacterium J06659_2]
MSAKIGRPLNDAERVLFKGAWYGQTYGVIAAESGYASSYLTRVVGPKFWKDLSQTLDENVSKTSFRPVIEQRYAQMASRSSHDTLPLPSISPTASPTAIAAFRSSQFPQIDWGEAPNVSHFYGRQTELETLIQWVVNDGCHLAAILGMGGIGKTALTAKFVETLAEQTDCPFAHIIWRSLRNAPSLESLLAELVPFLSHQQATEPTIRQLLQCLQESRCLLILDNTETILQSGSQAGYYRSGYEDYGELLRVMGELRHQSCLILTSREKPAEIAMFGGLELSVRSLTLSGSLETALALVDATDLVGTAEQKQDLCKHYGCSPLALKIVVSSIQDLFEGHISPFLAEETIVFNGVRRLLDQQFERLSELEQTIMYWLAINRDWTSISEFATDILPKVARSQLLVSLESLSWRCLLETASPTLIEKQSGKYTQQPVVMEYFTESLTQQIAQELSNQEFSLLTHHALLKTTAKDFVRDSQCRLILEPILDNLQTRLRSPSALAGHIQEILETLRTKDAYRPSYAGGNLLNLCR